MHRCSELILSLIRTTESTKESWRFFQFRYGTSKRVNLFLGDRVSSLLSQTSLRTEIFLPHTPKMSYSSKSICVNFQFFFNMTIFVTVGPHLPWLRHLHLWTREFKDTLPVDWTFYLFPNTMYSDSKTDKQFVIRPPLIINCVRVLYIQVTVLDLYVFTYYI